MDIKNLKSGQIESLMYRARKNWAAGRIVSASDFQFVERAWISYHLDKPLSHDQVKRLEALALQVGSDAGPTDSDPTAR